MKYFFGLFFVLFISNSCAPYESEAYVELKKSAFTLKDTSLTLKFNCNVMSIGKLITLHKDSFIHTVPKEHSPVKSISKLKDHNENFYVYVNNYKAAYVCFTNTENILDLDQNYIYQQFKLYTKEIAL